MAAESVRSRISGSLSWKGGRVWVCHLPLLVSSCGNWDSENGQEHADTLAPALLRTTKSFTLTLESRVVSPASSQGPEADSLYCVNLHLPGHKHDLVEEGASKTVRWIKDLREVRSPCQQPHSPRRTVSWATNGTSHRGCHRAERGGGGKLSVVK